MTEEKKSRVHPAFWVVSNYIAMGIPFSMVIWVSATMFKDLGHSDGEITVPLAMISIMWSLKPFWAGFLDMFKTKKFFVLSTEFVIGILLALMGLVLQLPGYFSIIIGLLWIVAFLSATQDICSDGIYISALDKSKYIGVQGMAWNLGRVIATAVIVGFAGYLQEEMKMSPQAAWTYALILSGAIMGLFGLWHTAMLPKGSLPAEREGQTTTKTVIRDFVDSAADFCNKRALWGMLAFVFFYRSSEGLLLLEAPLYMQGCLEDGALQLSLQDKGKVDGLVSTFVSIIGGLLGGLFISKFTLKRSLFLLALCINIPNACYVYLSQVVTPENPLTFGHIAFVVSLEKFWYSFGFVGNMLYMMQQIAPGKFKMTHYAFATAFMNLVLVPTQMASGPLADLLGFKEFFYLVMAACLPSLVAAWFAPFPQLGAKDEETSVDDASVLTDAEKKVQGWARQATIWAVLCIALFLFVDVMSLGWLSQSEQGWTFCVFLTVLTLTLPVKIWLSAKAIGTGRKVAKDAAPLTSGKAYLSNAKGSVVVGYLMLGVTSYLGYFVYEKSATTDWECAWSEDAAQCLQPDKKEPKQCEEKIIER